MSKRMRGKRFHCEMPVLALAGAPFSLSPVPPPPLVMSELDADLYGGKYVVTLSVSCIKNFFRADLYGTEDLGLDPTTENTHAEPQENSFPPEHHSTTRVTEPAVKNTAPSPLNTSVPTPPAPIASWSEPPSSTAERPAPPQAVNVLQQIPTYQESDGDDRGSTRSTYHGVTVEERSVRPSEMKDEG
jgi:hypothetical protein